MEISFITKCPNGYQVYLMCVNKDCRKPSGICERHGCSFANVHDRCNNYKEVKNIFQSLMDFAKQKSQETDGVVIGTINRMMKVLETLKYEYLSKSGSLENQLGEKRKELYKLMKNGPANDIKPQLVVDVLKGNNGEEKQSKSIKRLREIAERVEKMQKEGLREMRRQIRTGEKNQFVFDKELSRKDDVEITNKGKTLKKIQSLIGIDNLSLISPSVFETGNQKITLSLINKKGNYFSLGLGRKEKIVESNFKFPQNQQGVFVIWGDGQIINYSHPKQHRKSSEFRFGKGDAIDLEYRQQSQSLIVTNLTNKTTVTLLNITNEDKDLYYCVSTYNEGDQWAIIEQK